VSRPGQPAFSVSARDGWTLTDWFEDLYLQLAGPRCYELLAAHRLPWTDPTVLRTLREMASLLTPERVAGGIVGARRTGFEQSVVRAFGPAHAAVMVLEGDFVAGFVASSTRARLGVDVDVFAFPGADPARPAVVAGGDAAVLLRRSAAAERLLAYLASPAAATVWARYGGFVSPNLDVDLAVYPDPLTRSVARSLLDAGPDLRFDLSDLQPAQFGGRDDTGLPGELREFLNHRNAAVTAAALELEARVAYADSASASGGR
jgi:alpha-glucoside transport system substrate-binding protein